MRLYEVITTAPGNEMKRLVMLKIMIERGHQPEVVDAYYSKGHFGWGDLEELGFATRNSRRTRYGASESWTYSGPTPIVLVTMVGNKERRKLMNPGDTTEPVEVDYS